MLIGGIGALRLPFLIGYLPLIKLGVDWINALFATYVPVNVATLRDVMAARRAGRRKLRS